ncbi:MAG: YncE family protein [Terriglobales bacterium]|jgi:DNA-binding beta-propeller fold protein YncE
MKTAFFAFACLLSIAALPANCATHYKVTRRYVLGGEGGWDALTYDSTSRHLFISRGTHVIVVDPANGKQVGDIPDTPGVHDIALAPEAGNGFITAGKSNKAVIFDLNTLKVIRSIDVGKKPDAAVYEPATRRVFAFNADSNDATAIDAEAQKALGTIALGGNPEFAVADGRGQVFVNIESTGEIVEINAAKMTVMNRWPMKGCEEPSGLDMDAAHRVLFSGCHNKLLFVTDATNGKNLAQLPIGERVDGVGFDPGKHLAFSTNGDGTLTVIGGKGKKYQVEQNVTTQRGARTIAVNPLAHEVYTVTSEFEPPQPDNPNARPTPKAGTFTLLVISEK